MSRGSFAHVIALNLKRRHLDPVTWAEFFQRYCEARGVRLERGGDRRSTDTLAVDAMPQLAADLGVTERTARRLEAARLPTPLREKVRAGKLTLNAAKKEQRTQDRASHPTFDAYCRERWGWSRQYGYRLMDAAKVSTIVDNPPDNAEQARELVPLAHEDEQAARR